MSNAVVARSTFRSQKCIKLAGSELSKKCTPLWREAHFEVKSAKNCGVRSTFGRSDVLSRGRRNGLCTFSEVSKTWGFCSISKNDGRRGTFDEDLQRWISRGRRSTRDMLIRDVRRSGRWFPERGCILEHQIFRFAEMILRDRCSTSYELASLFRGRCSTLERWNGKIAKRTGTRLSALHSTLHVWRKSHSIASFLMLSTSKKQEISQNVMLSSSKTEEVSQNCCVLMLSSSKTEEVSQNRCVFKLADRQIDRETRQLQLQLQLQVPLHCTTTTTTSANILRYITQNQLHYGTLITSNSATLHKLHYNCYNSNYYNSNYYNSNYYNSNYYY